MDNTATTPPTTSDAERIKARGAEFAEVLIEGAELTDSLRHVCAWLERTWHRWLDMPRPTWAAYYVPEQSTFRPSLIFYAGSRARFETCVRALADGAPKVGPGAVRKNVDSRDAEVVEAVRMFGPVKVRVWTARENVCSRRVVGTETVEVPDPDAPMVMIEREVYEWDCVPILSTSDEVTQA